MPQNAVFYNEIGVKFLSTYLSLMQIGFINQTSHLQVTKLSCVGCIVYVKGNHGAGLMFRFE